MKYLIGLVVVIAAGVVGWQVVHEVEHNHDHPHDAAETAEVGALEPREPVRADGEFTLVTSFYPLQFALEQIVGEQATVINIGAGRDPHDFRPSTQNMVTLQRADAVVLQGVDFEPWGEAVAEQLAAGTPVVFATDAVELHEGGHAHEHDEEQADAHHEEDEHHAEEDEHHDEMGHEEEGHTEEPHTDGHDDAEHHDEHEEDEHHDEHEDEHDDTHTDEHGHDEHTHGAYDPHTWLDPVLFSEQVAYLATAVQALDPENAATYEANAAALQAELATLDAQFAEQLTSCQYEEVIVSHDFLGYVGDRYGLAFHAIAGLSTQDTPAATTLAALREEAAAGVGAVLLEKNAIAAYGETLARETGLATIAINPIAYLVPAGENYLTLQATNATALATAFGCNE